MIYKSFFIISLSEIQQNKIFDYYDNVIKIIENSTDFINTIIFDGIGESYRFDLNHPNKNYVKNFDLFGDYVKRKKLNVYCIHTSNQIKKYNNILPHNTKYLLWPTSDIPFFVNYLNTTYGNIRFQNHYKKEKLFTCLNGKPRRHREILVGRLFESGIINEGYVTFNTYNNSDGDVNYNAIYSPAEIKSITNFYANNKIEWEFPISNLTKKSHIELVTETEFEINALTEKTWKPIIVKKPFIILGGAGIHNSLKKMGFYLYEELFDYEFDSIPSLRERIEYIIKNIDKQKNQKNIETSIHDIQYKLDYNYKRLLEIYNNNEYFPSDIKDTMKFFINLIS